jgi:hypothetical protein
MFVGGPKHLIHEVDFFISQITQRHDDMLIQNITPQSL